MTRYHPPDHVTEDVLARDDFRQACAERELGAILHLANKWGGPGFTVSHIARRCEMTVSQVQEYIRAGRQAQSVAIWERVADGLHIPGRMLNMRPRSWEESGSDKPLDHSPKGGGRVGVELWTGSDSGGISEDADILMMIQEADRTDVGPGTLESLYAVFDRLCRDYPSSPAPELRRKLKQLYSRIIQLRQGRVTLAQHKELIALSGWVTALLACVDWDVNEREAAEAARSATHRFAQEIGHAELQAWSFELQAWFALTEGRYRDVTRIARDAQAVGGQNSAMVQLVMQEARGWSHLQEKGPAMDAMERGLSLLQQLPRAPYPRHFIYDETKFPFYVASCYQWLGEDAKAEEQAQRVIRECETNGTIERSPMRMAEVYVTLGLIHARRGELDAAVGSGARALLFDRKSEPHLLIRLSEFRSALASRFPNAPEVQEFDANLRQFRDGTASPAAD